MIYRAIEHLRKLPIQHLQDADVDLIYKPSSCLRSARGVVPCCRASSRAARASSRSACIVRVEGKYYLPPLPVRSGRAAFTASG
uniref:hypothetical protein n=1 Tax=Chlorogloea sp. CCALA 695 TaxID=2107693 RepID=UPI0030D8A8EC